ncbi:MAG TPA: SufE family protein [Gemmatimonadaceae bacterium]|nr:SufE family protein [Gemmatimonadaceae bacterium]
MKQTDSTTQEMMPPALERVLSRFRSMGREEKMASLVAYARKLEPLPPHLAALDRSAFTVAECQTRVDLFPEHRDGRLQFYADVNVRESPTVAAVLAIMFQAVNGQPPSVTLAIPNDIVRQLMHDIGLAGREVGLNAMIQRLKRHAAQASGDEAVQRDG